MHYYDSAGKNIGLEERHFVLAILANRFRQVKSLVNVRGPNHPFQVTKCCKFLDFQNDFLLWSVMICMLPKGLPKNENFLFFSP